MKAIKLSIAALEKDCEMGNDKRTNIKIKNLQKDIQIVNLLLFRMIRRRMIH